MITDETIINKLQDPKTINIGFKLLVEQYQEKLYWHIRRIVITHENANDVVQNTFIKIYKGIKSFRSESKLYTWLYRIASNEAITFINKQKRSRATSIDDEDYNIGNTLKADSYFDGDNIQRQLQKAITNLPPKQGLIFNMRYYEEMPYKDIAEVVGGSIGGLKANYHHAVKKIEAYFKEND